MRQMFTFPWKESLDIISSQRGSEVGMEPVHFRVDGAPTDSPLVTKALVRAADRLAVTNKVLAHVIGVSEPTLSRLRNGTYPLEEGQKAFELAVLFIRLYRSLDAVIGGDDKVASAWLSNPNTALGGVPLELIQSVSGLINVIQYLDARRGII
jgi:hypothetical protein